MKKRIAMISDHASPLAAIGGTDSGGQNVYVAQLTKSLALLGYDVDVFTRRDDRILPAAVLWENGSRIMPVSAGPPEPVPKEELMPYMREFAAKIKDLCLRQDLRYDLAHANFWMSGMVALELKRDLGLPFVITFHALGRVRRLHQGKADKFPGARLRLEEQAAREADRIIAESLEDRDDLIRHYGADPAKIDVVPCGFDPTELWPIDKNLARMVLGLKENEKVLLQLGRIVPRKGVDTAILALARLRKKHRISAKLLIVGGDASGRDAVSSAETKRLKRTAQREGVADNVVFAGPCGRDRLKFYYSAADAFIVTPWYEPFGITPLEAMACGRPVIGANVGGIKDTVVDGKTGFLVPPKNADAVAERAALLYRNPRLMDLLGRQAATRVHAFYTWRRVSESIAEIYDKVCARSQPAIEAAAEPAIDLKNHEPEIETRYLH